jgi:hypothetical protein
MSNTPMQAMIEGTPYRIFWLTVEFRKTLKELRTKLDAGLSTSTAFEIASDDLTRLYRQSCMLESVQPCNTMLEATAVDMQARFALDAAIGACNGTNGEAAVRKQFWATFRKATNPHSQA